MAIFSFRRRIVLRIETVLCLAVARLFIRFLPFRWWRSTLGPLGKLTSEGEQQLSAEKELRAMQVGRFVTRTAEAVPFAAVCLPQAMAGRWMLARRAIPTRIVIGSMRDLEEGGALKLHAWLIAGSKTVIGHDEREAYTPLNDTRVGAE